MAEENVNENTSAPSGEPVEVGPGESFASFDELESLTASRSRAREAGKAGKIEKPEAPSKPVKKAGEVEPTEKAEKADDDSEDESVVGEDGKKPKVEKQAAPKVEGQKLVKIKNGEEETELPSTAKIPVKVNGKDEEVTLEDLRSNYTGKKVWSAEFGKLGKDKAAFTQERQVVIQQLGKAFDIGKTDPIGGLMKFAEMSGMDPGKWRQEFLASLNPVLEKRFEMSDAERRAEDAEAEAAYYRNQTQSRVQEETALAAEKRFETETRAKAQSSGIDDATFEQTYRELEALTQRGEYKPEAGYVTPDDVITMALYTTKYEAVETAMKDLGDIPQDQKQKFCTEFLPLAVAQKLTSEEVQAVVRETFGNVRAANLSRKVRKAQPTGTRAPAQPLNPSSDPMSFDDL